MNTKVLLELYALSYGEALKEEEGSYGGKDLSVHRCLSASLSVSTSVPHAGGPGHLIYWYLGTPDWRRTLHCSHARLHHQLGHDCVLCHGQDVACPCLALCSQVRPWSAVGVTGHLAPAPYRLRHASVSGGM